ncbi:MAG: hypothetical protein KBD00_04165 [Candidatus Peribacteraceae bacterium]|nr:hypothetical protein [Candidatus Peribacteraceae bacterium]
MLIVLPWFSVLPLQIFLVSSLILIVGILLEIRRNVLHLSFLNVESLASIEKRHPHMPSMRIVMGILLCMLLLFIAAMISFSLWHVVTLVNWLYLAIFFLDAAVICILLEIRWKSVRAYAFPFMQGSLIAFTFSLFAAILYRKNIGLSEIILLITILLCGATASYLLRGAKNKNGNLIITGTFFVWLLVLFASLSLR